MLSLALCLSILINSPGYKYQFGGPENFPEFEGKILSSIKIVRQNVFDDRIREHTPFYYRWGNALHIKTKEWVVKNELLFNVGEPVDSLKIIESERNLRLRGFIGEAFVTALANGPDSVDLTVTTIDYWTTKIAVNTELGGGKYSIGAAASEVNLLGYGQSVEISGQKGSDADSYSLYVADDRIGGSRLAGSFYYIGTTLGDALSAYLARPQYSVSVKSGFLAKYREEDAITRLFSNGVEFFRYRRLYRELDSKYIYSLGKLRRFDILAKYNYESRQYSPDDYASPLNHIIPIGDKRSYPSIGVGFSIIKYDLQRFLDEAGTPEDLTLGAAVRLSIGRSLTALGANFDGMRPEITSKFLVKPQSWIFFGAKDKIFWWRHGNRNIEIRNQGEIMAYFKTGNASVLTARWLLDFAWRQKSAYQVILGGTNGLRGYSAYRFSGDRATVGNMEYRFYLPLEILTVRIGGAAFFDIGSAWSRGEKIAMSDLRSDIGVGLRFGLTKSSTSRILRLDLARSLSNKNYYVSFGSTVLFSLKSFDNNE